MSSLNDIIFHSINQIRKLFFCCLPVESFQKIAEDSDDENKTSRVYVRFDNETNSDVSVIWYNHLREEKWYFDLKPGCCLSQGSYPRNVWLVKEKESKKLIMRIKVDQRERQLCRILPSVDYDTTVNLSTEEDESVPSCYVHKVFTDNGFPVVGYSAVNLQALKAAKEIIECMLQGCSPSIIATLQKYKFKVAVMSKEQNTTDIKEYLYLQGSSASDGRDWDHEVRGLGATKANPTCTVGEENVLRKPYPDDKYYRQSILVHELGHSVMEVTFDEEMTQRIKDIYNRSKAKYTPGIYMIADEKEYWALGSEAWFDASKRASLNDGVNSREKVKAHDPELAAFLRQVYGDGHWRYDFTPYPAAEEGH